MGEVNVQLITEEINTLTPRQLEEVMHFVGYLKSLPITPQCQDESEETRQEVIKNSLKLLHKAGTFSDIDDPVEWQREVRTDRQLPGRAN
ncbi:hypothetical protein [Leucothrix pacifica]|uniref:DUF2281 domain-containing protein n=1 Tax=Leucothrix pacifica TaxID=1247513 RepID=A0A317C3S8_9GAMM|nr:hypothetical protein [Leucothrix pacifica]PWQ92831.1 hypothetical protein DKW60_18990 [Leucothrix pacifica]